MHDFISNLLIGEDAGSLPPFPLLQERIERGEIQRRPPSSAGDLAAPLRLPWSFGLGRRRVPLRLCRRVYRCVVRVWCGIASVVVAVARPITVPELQPHLGVAGSGVDEHVGSWFLGAVGVAAAATALGFWSSRSFPTSMANASSPLRSGGDRLWRWCLEVPCSGAGCEVDGVQIRWLSSSPAWKGSEAEEVRSAAPADVRIQRL